MEKFGNLQKSRSQSQNGCFEALMNYFPSPAVAIAQSGGGTGTGQKDGLRSSNSKAAVNEPTSGPFTRITRQPTSLRDSGLIRVIFWPTVMRNGTSSNPPSALTMTVDAYFWRRS